NSEAATGSPCSAAATGQALAIGAENHAPDRGRVPLERDGLLSGLCIPHLHRVVRTSAGQAPTVRAECYELRSLHALPTARLESEEFLVFTRIPNLDGLVRRAAGQMPAVRAEDHVVDVARMPLERSDFLARLGIPYSHRFVPIRRAGQALAV